MFPINFSSKKGGFQGTSGEDWTKIVAHKHWLLRELYGRNSIVPHISTFPTIFVQKVRSKGALSSFLTGERAKPSLFVQHKLTQTIRARTEKSDQLKFFFYVAGNMFNIYNDDKSITRKINVLQSSKEEH